MAISATETGKAELTFYRESQIQGVVIKGYQTVNGIFNDSYFMEELLKNQRKISFSGAGASHQDGSVEHSINMLVTMASTMLIHATLICPGYKLITDLWPMKN